MKQRIIDGIFAIIKKFVSSVDNSTNGFSGRKLTVITIMALVIMMHRYYVEYAFINKDFSHFTYVLAIDYIMISICLGLILVEKLNVSDYFGKNKLGENQEQK